MSLGFHLRGLEPGDGEAILEIERRATAMLVATGIHPDRPPTPAVDLARFLIEHETIVAERDGDDAILGYACGRDLGSLYWLAELAVDPAAQRKGIGRSLLRAIAELAESRFHRALGLTTYREVPFNAPFYRQCGFLAVPREDHDAILEDRFLAELPPGAALETRTVMIRWLR